MGTRYGTLSAQILKRPDHAPSLQLIFPVYRVHEAEEISFKTGWQRYQSGYTHLQGLLIAPELDVSAITHIELDIGMKRNGYAFI
jgi:hypothetical protein